MDGIDGTSGSRLSREILVCVGLAVTWFCGLGYLSLLNTVGLASMTTSVWGALPVVVWASILIGLSRIYAKATLQGTRRPGASPWAVAYDDLGRLLLMIFAFLLVGALVSFATPQIPTGPFIAPPNNSGF